MTEDTIRGKDSTEAETARHEKRKMTGGTSNSASDAEEDTLPVPPRKTRKREEEQTQEADASIDDAVAFARKALEMYKQEVQDDGDFQEPDTTPAVTAEESGSKTAASSSSNGEGVSKENGSNGDADDSIFQTATDRWQKIGRQPMISDDPTML